MENVVRSAPSLVATAGVDDVEYIAATVWGL